MWTRSCFWICTKRCFYFACSSRFLLSICSIANPHQSGRWLHFACSLPARFCLSASIGALHFVCRFADFVVWTKSAVHHSGKVASFCLFFTTDILLQQLHTRRGAIISFAAPLSRTHPCADMALQLHRRNRFIWLWCGPEGWPQSCFLHVCNRLIVGLALKIAWDNWQGEEGSFLALSRPGIVISKFYIWCFQLVHGGKHCKAKPLRIYIYICIYISIYLPKIFVCKAMGRKRAILLQGCLCLQFDFALHFFSFGDPVNLSHVMSRLLDCGFWM